MRNVRILLFILFSLLGCAHQPANERLPANGMGACFVKGRGVLRSLQTKLTLKSAIERTRPGQLGYGRPKVDLLKKRFEDSSFSEIQEYLDARPIPYVENPEGKWVIHDRHHLFLGLVKSREVLEERFPEKSLKLTYHRTASFKGKGEPEYRKFMEGTNRINLDFKGSAIAWRDLPNDFQSMKKDFFRGMAYLLIKAEILEKVTVPFSEFKWANALRKRFPYLKTKWRIKNIEEVFEDVIDNPEKYPGLKGRVEDPPDLDEAMDNIEDIVDELGWN
ncbi:MAG: ParB/Srx family N-terminal domain-containing protein [Bacteriovoracaceae bacterium]|nr:ParB/Srx family N-terminal domain-containing protein [Bacteriovoracaceae bacterium]